MYFIGCGQEIGRSRHSRTVLIEASEQTGLIPTADRTASGDRDYSKNDANMLRFIRRPCDFAFAIGKIDALIELWHAGSRHNAYVKRIVGVRSVCPREKKKCFR